MRAFSGFRTQPLALLLALSAACAIPINSRAATNRPNVLIILADDMGYSDLGCYGSEISTPNLDRLAAGGLRFTQFYNTARCWPTRAAILTGYYAQQVRRDLVPGIPSGGRGTRPKWARLLPEMLKPMGYRCYHSGKWHVDGKPTQNGFDHSYYLEDCGRYFGPKTHFEDDEKLPPVERHSGYYSTVAIADHAIQYLKEHAASHPKESFFEYVAFTSPHFPLQAKPEDIARYTGKYSAGWEVLREERWRRMTRLGIVSYALPAIERQLGPPYDFPEALKKLGPGETNRPAVWTDLSAEQQKFQAAKMEIHAAMVDRMDREIGRIVDQLRAMRALDNTIIFFLSDNGASAEIMVREDGHDASAPPGSAATHLCLGPGWSSVANTPLRRQKTWVHEGGISTPLIVHWPQGISAKSEFRRAAAHVVDLVPTILDLASSGTVTRAGGLEPAQSVPPAPGQSFARFFQQDGAGAHETIWWEHEGNRALQAGSWKIVAAKNSPWELYDLKSDRGESHNLAQAQPDKLNQLAKLWEDQYQEYCELARKDAPVQPPQKKKRTARE